MHYIQHNRRNPLLARIFAVAETFEKHQKASDEQTAQTLRDINAIVDRSRPLPETTPQELLFDGLNDPQNRLRLDGITFVPQASKKDLKQFEGPLWVLDDLPLEVNYDYPPNQDIRAFKITPYFGNDSDDNSFAKKLETLLVDIGFPEKNAKEYSGHLGKRLAVLRKKVNEDKARYEQKREPHETKLLDAQEDLLRVLDTRTCDTDRPCDNSQECLFGYCKNHNIAPRGVILDFDETLGYFSRDFAFLQTLAHALNQYTVPGLGTTDKRRILERAAVELARDQPRENVQEFVSALANLKKAGLINRVNILTKAVKADQKLFHKHDPEEKLNFQAISDVIGHLDENLLFQFQDKKEKEKASATNFDNRQKWIFTNMRQKEPVEFVWAPYTKVARVPEHRELDSLSLP